MKCSLCGDEAVRGVVVTVDRGSDTASIQVDGQCQTVALDLVQDVNPGDTVMVHQGFAIARVDGP